MLALGLVIFALVVIAGGWTLAKRLVARLAPALFILALALFALPLIAELAKAFAPVVAIAAIVVLLPVAYVRYARHRAALRRVLPPAQTSLKRRLERR